MTDLRTDLNTLGDEQIKWSPSKYLGSPLKLLISAPDSWAISRPAAASQSSIPYAHVASILPDDI